MAVFSASGAHVPKSTLRSGSRNPPFSARPDLNHKPPGLPRSGLARLQPAQHKRFDPDKVIAYATQEPKVAGNEIRTRGGVFRSNGQWYRVAYKCVTAPDHMQVLSLRYKIGDRIPKDEWDQYNLYP